MNGLITVVDTFNALKNKGWIKAGTNIDDEILFPSYQGFKVICVGDSNRYPIWLLSIRHELPINYCNNRYHYSVETDRYNDSLRLLVYLDNNLITQKDLIKLTDLREMLKDELSNLVLIYSDNKIVRRVYYYRYNEMKILKYKGIDVFLNLLNKNIIKIKITNTSIRFIISKKELDKLFKIEYNYTDKLNSFLSFLDK